MNFKSNRSGISGGIGLVHVDLCVCEQKCLLGSGFKISNWKCNPVTAGVKEFGWFSSNVVGDRFKWIWDGRTGIGDQNIITSFNDLDENGT